MVVEKKFSELLVGDRIRTIAKITNMKSDQKNKIPKWHLLYLFDGSKTIRIFLNDISTYNVGDYLDIEFSVKEGKPWNGNPQLAYDLYYISKTDAPIETSTPQEELKKSSPKPTNGIISFLRKEELKDVNVETNVQFYTRIRTLTPKDGMRETNQKILLVDLENKPVGLWLPKTEFEVFKAVKEGEYFVVNAIVKKTHDNPFLVFKNMIRGEQAHMSDIAQKFFHERIKYFAHELEKYLRLITKNTEDHEFLVKKLESFNKNVYGE